MKRCLEVLVSLLTAFTLNSLHSQSQKIIIFWQILTSTGLRFALITTEVTILICGDQEVD